MMKQIEKNKKFWLFLFFFAIFFLLSLYLVHKEFQNDTFYTIKVGEVISKFGVDGKDHFSFVKGLDYCYPHWLYDLFIYKLYSFAGFKGLFISCIVFSFGLLSAMFLTTRKIVNDDGVAFLVTALSSTFLTDFIAVRAQLVSYIIILLILFCIEMIRKSRKNRYMFIAFLLSILLVNVHCAVYLFVFVLFLPYLVSDLCYVLKNRLCPKTSLVDTKESIISIDKPSNDIKLLITMGLIAVAGFISPNFPYSYLYMPLIMIGKSTAYIMEHQAASFNNNAPLFFIFFIFVIVLCIPKIKIKLHDMFMILGLFLMSLLSLRSFAFLIIMSIYSCSRIVYTLFYTRLKHIKIVDVFRIKTVYASFLLIAAVAFGFDFYLETKESYINEEQYPVEMANYIKENIDVSKMRLYNGYDFGSYLLFNDIPVFVDSRSDLYLPEFNKNNSQFMDSMKMISEYKFILLKYDFTHILIYKDSNFNRILENLDEYKVIKKDTYFVLYEKI